MNTYIVYTSNGDKWEVAYGSYLVRALNLDYARKKVKIFFKENGIIGNKIMDIVPIDSIEVDVYEIQGSVTE